MSTSGSSDRRPGSAGGWSTTRRLALVSALSALVAVAAPVSWWWSQTPPAVGAAVVDVRARPGTGTGAGAAGPGGTGPAEVGPAEVGGADAASLGVATGPTIPPGALHPATPPPPRPPGRVPVTLTIAAVGLRAKVDPVGVDGHGQMALPSNAQQLGWYRFGAAPGDRAGTVVVAGHVDAYGQGLGQMAKLPGVQVGDLVKLGTRDSNGGTGSITYRVTGRQEVAKAGLPTAAVFRKDGPPRLVLVTCGGYFDRSGGHYQDNVLVAAVPTGR